MKSLTVCLVVGILLSACGGDSIESAENCTELSRAAQVEAVRLVEEAGGSDYNVDDATELLARVDERAAELGGDALARDAGLEADACARAADEALSVLADTIEDGIPTDLIAWGAPVVTNIDDLTKQLDDPWAGE